MSCWLLVKRRRRLSPLPRATNNQQPTTSTMRKHRMPEIKVGGVNVTPLIDIVMCLIIFFMLVAKIGVSDGSDKSIEVPASIWGTELKDKGNMLTLNVRERNAGGEPLITGMVDGSHGKPIEI